MVSTYSEAGVDIDASEKATEALIAQIKNVGRKGDGEAIKLDNGFAGLVKLGDGALRAQGQDRAEVIPREAHGASPVHELLLVLGVRGHALTSRREARHHVRPAGPFTHGRLGILESPAALRTPGSGHVVVVLLILLLVIRFFAVGSRGGAVELPYPAAHQARDVLARTPGPRQLARHRRARAHASLRLDRGSERPREVAVEAIAARLLAYQWNQHVGVRPQRLGEVIARSRKPPTLLTVDTSHGYPATNPCDSPLGASLRFEPTNLRGGCASEPHHRAHLIARPISARASSRYRSKEAQGSRRADVVRAKESLEERRRRAAVQRCTQWTGGERWLLGRCPRTRCP